MLRKNMGKLEKSTIFKDFNFLSLKFRMDK